MGELRGCSIGLRSLGRPGDPRGKAATALQRNWTIGTADTLQVYFVRFV